MLDFKILNLQSVNIGRWETTVTYVTLYACFEVKITHILPAQWKQAPSDRPQLVTISRYIILENPHQAG